MSRLKTIGDTSGTLAAYKYLGLGQVVVEDFPEAQVKLDYLGSSGNLSGFDRFGRIADQLWEHYHLASGDEVVDGTVDEYSYAYDRAGNVTGKTNALDAALSELYGYNNLDELTSTTRDETAYQSWGLDATGNWLTSTTGSTTDTKTFNAANETTDTTASVTPTYDAAGNAIVTAQPGNATTALNCVYDAWNRVVSATYGSTTVTYQYDGQGRRTERIVGTTVEHDYYSGQQTIQVYTFNGSTFEGGQQYVWSPLYVDTPIVRDTYNSGGTDVGQLYCTTDANHNVTAVTNASGVVQERYAYTAFGDVTYYNADWTLKSVQTSGVSNTRLFAGMDLDPLTGAYDDNFRWYNSTTGDLFGRDPIGYAGGINLYGYVGDDPLTYTDPLGTKPGDCTSDINISPPHTIRTGTVPLPFGLSGSVEITESSSVSTTTCEVCCPGGGTGTKTDVRYNASYTLALSATKKWGIISDEADDEKLRTKLLQAGVRANLTASVTVGLDFNLSFSTCANGGLKPGKVCANADGSISASVTARSQTLLWKAEASVVGAATFHATVCANINADGSYTVGQPDWSIVDAGLGYKLTWSGPLGRHWSSGKVRRIL